jgi:peptidoglycan DL-endopeptidase CwlO
MQIRLFSILVFVSLFFNSLFAQNKKLDKIEMLYDQGNYKKAMTKSESLMANPAYKNHPTPLLFYSLSKYQISKTNTKISSSEAIYDYEKFLKSDTSGKYFKAYANYIYDMQLGISDEIRKLNAAGKKDEAHVKYNTYQRLFGNVAKFDELVIENTTSTSKPNADISKSRKEIIAFAKKLVGTPYLYGGITTKGFDCSGFTSYVFQNNGYSLPRTAQGQSERFEKVKLNAAEPGDLVFFGSSKTNISHVGIVISEKGQPLEMIHASTSRGVIMGKIEADPYWSPRLQFVVRVVNE